MTRLWLALLSLALLAGCAGGGGSPGGGGGGRYAMNDDAYPDSPEDVSNVPDAVPKVEPRAKSGNRPTYSVWGKTYHVLSDPIGYVAEGRASWYGVKFQGYATASGESYDMYKMTAAHRSLPLPTYARVTNLDNGRQVIVRVNDRGPFHDDRLIDLSYAAAARLDILGHGTGRVRVEAIDPVAWARTHDQSGSNRSTQNAQATPPKATAQSVAAAPPAQSAPAGVSRSATQTQPLDDYATQVDPILAAAEDGPVAGSEPAPADTGSSRHYVQVAALGSESKALALKTRLQGLLSRPVRIDNAASLYRVQVGPIDDLASLETIRATLSDAGYRQTFVVSPTQ
jgi:rare lipoprotein A